MSKDKDHTKHSEKKSKKSSQDNHPHHSSKHKHKSRRSTKDAIDSEKSSINSSTVLPIDQIFERSSTNLSTIIPIEDNYEDSETPLNLSKLHSPIGINLTKRLTRKVGHSELKAGNFTRNELRQMITIPDDEDEIIIDEEENNLRTVDLFNATIRGHPESKLDDTECEIIFKHGRVTDIAVPSDIMEIVKKNDRLGKHICRCCYENTYKLSEGLEKDLAAQGTFLSRVLITEMLIYIPALVWLAMQGYIQPLHDFLYIYWIPGIVVVILLNLMVFVGVACTDLARHKYWDWLLLIPKILGRAHLCGILTIIVEGLAVRWVYQQYDLDDPTSLETIEGSLHDPKFQHSYPYIIPLLIIHIMVFQIVLAIFFRFFKGNVQKDRMFCVTVLLQLGMIIVTFVVIRMNPNEIFIGPTIWDTVQILISGVSAGAWQLSRLFNLREVMLGKKFELEEKQYKLVALSFAL